MTMRIVIELSDKDLSHFRKLARQAMESSSEVDPDQVIAGARALLEEISGNKPSDFIKDRLALVHSMIDMLEDEGWGMQEVGRKRIVTALAYLVQSDDLIPDSIPGIGFLDDAIMIELLARELKPELEAYDDFVKYRTAEAKRLGKKPEELNRTDYLEAREQALLSRMRRRRRGARSAQSGGRRKSPFSLF